MKRKWTRGEKLLWLAPLIFVIGAGVAAYGPDVVRRQLGRPVALETTPDSVISAIALSSDGSTLVATTGESYAPKINGGALYFWDARTLKPVVPWGNNANSQINDAPAFRTENRALTLSPNAKSVGFVRVNLLKKGLNSPYVIYNMTTGRVRWQIAGKYVLSDAHLSPEGTILGVTEPNGNGNDTAYQFLRATDGVQIARFLSEDISFDYSDFAWMPDSKSIVCLARSPDPFPLSVSEAEWQKNRAAEQFFFQTRRLIDGKQLQSWKTRPVLRFALSPDGQFLIATTGDRTDIGFKNVNTTLFDRATGRQIWSFKGTKSRSNSYYSPLAFRFAPDAKTIAVLIEGFSQTVALLDAQSGVRQRTLNLGGQSGYFRNVLAWSPDGKRLFARGKNAVLVWDLD